MMAIDEQPDAELNHPTDPAQLGAPEGPGTTPEDDSRDMSTVVADAGDGPDDAQRAGDSGAGRGSAFDQQRRDGAEGQGDNSETVGRGQGMGRAGFNGDVDRGYDQSGHRGGLGTSGGREDLSDRQLDADGNPFTGGYGGGDYDQPQDDALRQRLGLHTPNPTEGHPDAPAPASNE